MKVFDVATGEETLVLANRTQPHHRQRKGTPAYVAEETAEDVDFVHKVMHIVLHPSQNVLALTALNNLFIYS